MEGIAETLKMHLPNMQSHQYGHPGWGQCGHLLFFFLFLLFLLFLLILLVLLPHLFLLLFLLFLLVFSELRISQHFVTSPSYCSFRRALS